jgi:hypothetical protein
MPLPQSASGSGADGAAASSHPLTPFTSPGWLLRVVCNEQLREEFVTLHEAVEEILKVLGGNGSRGGAVHL